MSAMELAMIIDAVLLVAATAATMLLPRPGAARGTPARQVAAGQK